MMPAGLFVQHQMIAQWKEMEHFDADPGPRLQPPPAYLLPHCNWNLTSNMTRHQHQQTPNHGQILIISDSCI